MNRREFLGGLLALCGIPLALSSVPATAEPVPDERWDERWDVLARLQAEQLRRLEEYLSQPKGWGTLQEMTRKHAVRLGLLKERLAP